MHACLALAALLTAAPNGPVVSKLADSLVDPHALTIQGDFGQAINGLSFQQDALSSLGGWQYLAWYSDARQVCASRRRLPDGAWQHIRFGDYDFKSNDAHNVVSLGICPGDGTIHLSWDHHGAPLHYRRSQPGAALEPAKVEWTAALFGPVTNQLEAGKVVAGVTYPKFIRTPEGGLQVCYRTGGSGNGQRLLADYDLATHAWSNTHQIDSGKGSYTEGAITSTHRCSYPNGYTYGPDGRLHLTWVWREDAQGANHDLCYTWSDDHGNTWHNSAGVEIGRKGGALPNVDSPGLAVVRIPLSLGMMNDHGQAVDSKNRIHCVMWHASPEDIATLPPAERTFRFAPTSIRRYRHYFREVDGTWQQRVLPELADGRGRPKLAVTPQDDLLLVYNHAGGLHVMGATAAAGYRDWKVVYAEAGPFLNEMLYDPHRWQAEGVLSVMVQEPPSKPHEATRLQVVDLAVR